MLVAAQEVAVKCYSGHEYAERPESFTWKGKEYEAEEVERAWREPGERHFRVVTAEGQRFELRYKETEDQWLLTEL